MPSSSTATKEIVLAFDAYGTLLSTASISKELAKHFGDEKADEIATLWRTLQLEYSWRMNSMDKYEPFSNLTRNSLLHALATHSLTLSNPAIDAIMEKYNTLSLFPDVPPLFPLLKDPPTTKSDPATFKAVIFSNGTHSMISTTLAQSPDLSPHAHLFGKIVSVDAVGKFKPEMAVYEFLCKEVGKGEDKGDVWLISGNPFDVVGAKLAGMRACWVDREGKGWTDRLMGEEVKPDVIVKGVGEVVEGVVGFLEGR